MMRQIVPHAIDQESEVAQAVEKAASVYGLRSYRPARAYADACLPDREMQAYRLEYLRQKYTRRTPLIGAIGDSYRSHGWAYYVGLTLMTLGYLGFMGRFWW